MKIKVVFTVVLLALLFACKDDKSGYNEAAGSKPNIVFIYVDDLGYGEVGFTGSVFYETPEIDALAKNGMVMKYAYMYPTCSPSRTALFTGKQSFRTGVYTVPVLERGDENENIFSRWTVGEEHIGYSEELAKVGYKMIHLGKWHLVGPYPLEERAMEWPIKEKLSQPDPWDFSWVETHRTPEVVKYYPEGRGYMKNVGGTYRGDPALEVGGYKGVTGGYFAPFSNPFLGQKPDDEWLTDRLTNDAIAFMDEHKDGPFFINLHYYTVHKPLRARSEELMQKYLNKEGDPLTGQGMREGKLKESDAMYATMIESLDDNVGKIVTFLEENDLRENTLIIFSSDNGQNGKPYDLLRGSKGQIYEGGIRVPTFFYWPGKVKAGSTEVPVHVCDFFPTFMELAGVDHEGVLDGESLVELFDGESKELEHRPLYWHIASQWKHGTCSAIRKDDKKLIQFLATGEIELYDLKADPTESHNLVEEQPELAKKMLDEMQQWRKENNVPLPPNSVCDY